MLGFTFCIKQTLPKYASLLYRKLKTLFYGNISRTECSDVLSLYIGK